MHQYQSYADEEEIEEDAETDGYFVLEGVNSHYIRSVLYVQPVSVLLPNLRVLERLPAPWTYNV